MRPNTANARCWGGDIPFRGVAPRKKDVFVRVSLYMWSSSGRGQSFSGSCTTEKGCVCKSGTVHVELIRAGIFIFGELHHGKTCVCESCIAPDQCSRARIQRHHTTEDPLPHCEARGEKMVERERSVHIRATCSHAPSHSHTHAPHNSRRTSEDTSMCQVTVLHQQRELRGGKGPVHPGQAKNTPSSWQALRI